MTHRRPSPREAGAALLTVLLLIAVIATIATVLLDRVRLGARLAGAVAGQADARGLALAAEAIALRRLAAPGATDTAALRAVLGRAVAVPLPAMLGKADTIRATATLRDAGDCVNWNGLRRADGAVDEPALAMLGAVGRASGLAPDMATGAARALADAPGPHADLGALATVAGLDPNAAATLRPWLCALPDARALPINLDTLAPARAVLAAAQVPGDALSVEAARAALASRPAGGYGSVVAFWDQPALGGARPLAPLAEQTGVRTRWLAMTTRIEAGDQAVAAHALIDLDGPAGTSGDASSGPRVVRRRWTAG